MGSVSTENGVNRSMPIPTPKKDEEQENFMERCMSSPAMKKEFPDNKQRVAVCLNTFTRGKKKKSDGSAVTWDDYETSQALILP